MRIHCFPITLTIVGLAGLSAQGQIGLYEESFPYTGEGAENIDVATVGWANDVPTDPLRLFTFGGPGSGGVFAWQADGDVPVTTAFYTTESLDAGITGMPFPSVPVASTSELTLLVDIRAGFDSDNVASRFAVQMNGTNWYASATTLPVPEAQETEFNAYALSFDPAQDAWNTLELLGTGAAIGGPAPEDLSGTLTGAGLVITHTEDNGTHDFDNFRMVSSVGKLNVDDVSGGEISFSWMSSPEVRLQSAATAPAPTWQDVSNTLGQSAASVPMTQDREVFRLSSLPGDEVDATNPILNPGFDLDGVPVSEPYGWTASGKTAASHTVADGSSLSLQHSSAVDYQVVTSQLVSGLSNGFYSLSGTFKSSGGQALCHISGNGKRTGLPALDRNWSDVIVRGISVTNGECLVEVVSDAAAGQWCRIDSLALVRDDVPYTFLKGGDVSELPRLEYYGGTFYDNNGAEADCLQVMKDNGCNIARVRLYNDPGNPCCEPANRLDPLGWQNPSNTLALCQRVKDAGMQIQLTFHYSDYWTNPGRQTMPHEWEGLSFEELTNAVYTFTRDFMQDLADQDTIPEYVSLGNEIPTGILWPLGRNDTPEGWDRLATLLRLGYEAVKSVAPSSQVIIHIDREDVGTVTWYFNNLVSRGTPFDIIGCSYYPHWSGRTTEQMRDNISAWQATFNKPVIIMETGYNWDWFTCDGGGGQLGSNGPEIYRSSPQGQKDFLLKCFKDIKLVTDGACIGDLYWDPIFICVPGQGWQTGARNVVANTALFDFDGHPLPSFDAFRYND